MEDAHVNSHYTQSADAEALILIRCQSSYLAESPAPHRREPQDNIRNHARHALIPAVKATQHQQIPATSSNPLRRTPKVESL